MTLDKILKTNKEDFTQKELYKLVDSMQDFCYHTRLTPEEIHWLFYYMCVKDEDGVWRGLIDSEYQIIFEGGFCNIKLVPNEHLYNEDETKLHFKKYYYIRKYVGKNDIAEGIVKFPKYTGYERVLNGEEEDLLGFEEDLK